MDRLIVNNPAHFGKSIDYEQLLKCAAAELVEPRYLRAQRQIVDLQLDGLDEPMRSRHDVTAWRNKVRKRREANKRARKSRKAHRR